ncbi:MAG: HAMP domain-containing sensor histidine kinase [Xenococcus sp. MO_188.B8]|nr:HAMP domain-containing sensor histidine kinase [Xenococcus sp. MO_188.B8]
MAQALKQAVNPELQKELAIFQHLETHLIDIVGYELWNPLSTIQVCLETLANESSMTIESKQLLLDTAIQDVYYLRQLITDCINVSQLESENHNERSRELENILQKTLAGILPLYQVTDLAYLVKQKEQNLNFNESQEETLEHIRHNFIAIVGHELRTPLCTIEVCLESLTLELETHNKDEAYQQEMLEIALNDLERLKQLIRDFFTLARLQRGQLYQHQEYVEVQSILELALTGFKHKKSGRRLPTIKMELPLELPKIKTNGDRLVEAITKLLDNACKFTQPQGEITIQVQLQKESTERLSNLSKAEENQLLEVIISDTGRGIAPHNLKAIFNCFYQEENALKRTVNGVGIGLTICSQIIQSLGGKIWAHSAGKEQGSSIHFTLPVTT